MEDIDGPNYQVKMKQANNETFYFHHKARLEAPPGKTAYVEKYSQTKFLKKHNRTKVRDMSETPQSERIIL